MAPADFDAVVVSPTQPNAVSSLSAPEVLATISDGIVVLSREWNFLYLNPAAEAALGIEAPAVLGKNHSREFPAIVGTQLEILFRRVAETGNAEAIEYFSNIRKKWFHVMAHPSAVGITICFRDITAARAERASQLQAEDRFRLAASHRLITLFEQDVDLRYTWLYPLHPEHRHAIGRTDEELGPDDSNRELANMKRRVIATGVDLRTEYKVQLADGFHHYDIFITPRRDSHGAIDGIAGTALDITDKKRAEEAKDNFLAALSHELRTPLTPVLAIVSGLQENGTLTEEVRADLATLRRNIEMEVRLIDDLLELTRISSGKLKLRLERVTVQDVIRDAIETCGADLEKKGLRLVGPTPGGSSWVMADRARLTQVIWNLLKNAIKFTPAGGAVTVAVGEDAPPGTVVVSIEDTGIGIAAGEAEKIFEAFRQGTRQASRAEGLGLGLSIARGIAEAHGGTLTAASGGPDRGSCFTLTLARSEARSAEAVSPGPTAEAKGAGSSSPAVVRVLLVEDHADTRRVMARLLRRTGYEVLEAASVSEARALAARAADQGGLSLVISDVGLPDGTGHELMRDLTARFGVRGIALSGFGMESDRAESEAAGFSGHLTKPVTIDSLRAAIGKCLEKEGSGETR